MKKTITDFKECVCPVCGKTFIPAPLHRYKLDGRDKLVCSWHCLCESRRKRGIKQPSGRAKIVVKYDADGNEIARYSTIRAAAKAHNVQPPTMSTYIWQKRILKDGSYFKIIEEKDWYKNG